MDRKTAHMLNQLTSDFYARNAASFSSTRTRPWAGWERCLELLLEAWGGDAIEGRGQAEAPRLQILDMGCGNLRFEAFVSERTNASLRIFAVDNCPALVDTPSNANFQQVDIVSTLLDGEDLAAKLDAPSCDTAVAFGLMHHIPGRQARLALLDALLDKTKPGGLVMLTLWQFERDERLRAKACAATATALKKYPQLQLGEGDWLLGWQDTSDSFRYCHSFSDEEIDGFIKHTRSHARLIDRFQADGKSNDLNCYLVFERE